MYDANHTIGVNPLLSLYGTAQTTCVMVPFAMMLGGTGSVYGMEHSDRWVPHLKPRVPFIVEADLQSSAAERVDVRTPLEHLENIRTVLNPAIADLASVFDVSRQAVYKWLSSEAKPEPEKLVRIQVLSQIADAFKAANVARAGSLLKMKTFGERSLMDIVKVGEDWHGAVDILIAESRAMERAYERSGLDKSRAKPTSDWQTCQSIPAPYEDR